MKALNFVTGLLAGLFLVLLNLLVVSWFYPVPIVQSIGGFRIFLLGAIGFIINFVLSLVFTELEN